MRMVSEGLLEEVEGQRCFGPIKQEKGRRNGKGQRKVYVADLFSKET